jgi:hypothetical protein
LSFQLPISGLLWANPLCGNAAVNNIAEKASAIVVKARRFIVFLPELEKVAAASKAVGSFVECEWSRPKKSRPLSTRPPTAPMLPLQSPGFDTPR